MSRMAEHAADRDRAISEFGLAPEGDYAGYPEHSFLMAFDALCKDAGGYKKGAELARKIIKEQVS